MSGSTCSHLKLFNKPLPGLVVVVVFPAAAYVAFYGRILAVAPPEGAYGLGVVINAFIGFSVYKFTLAAFRART